MIRRALPVEAVPAGQDEFFGDEAAPSKEDIPVISPSSQRHLKEKQCYFFYAQLTASAYSGRGIGLRLGDLA